MLRQVGERIKETKTYLIGLTMGKWNGGAEAKYLRRKRVRALWRFEKTPIHRFRKLSKV